jgi:4-amino-4-deoxy-L-arabinose transferase-like glycosyltransferase
MARELTNEQLQVIRDNPGLSDRQLADKIGCSRQQVARARIAAAPASGRTRPVATGRPSLSGILSGGAAADAADHPGRGSALEWCLASAIIALGALLRAAHYFQIKANDPYFALPTVDPRVYHEWAIRLSKGDWIGTDVFEMSPGYPYFLGVMYWLFGSGFEVSHIANAVLGALAVLFIWLLGRIVFGWREALVAAGFAALYPMFLYTGGDLLSENLQVTLNAIMLVCLCAGIKRPRWWLFLAAGAMLGLSALCRPNVLLFAPVAVLCIAATRLDGVLWRSIAVRSATVAIGAILMVAPATIRNWHVAGDPVLITAHGGMNFYIGNNSEAIGRFKIPTWIPDTRFDNPRRQSDFAKEYAESKVGRTLKPSEVSSYWSGMAWEWIRQNPGKAISLAGRKFYLLLSSNEVGDQRQLHLDAAYSWVLRMPFPTFIVVVPLGVLGLALTLPRWRRVLTVDAFLVSQVAALIIIYTSARYRLPMMPAIMTLAGFAAVWLVDTARARKWVPFGAAAWAFALVLFFTVRPTEATVFSSNYFNLANKFRDMGKDDQAIELYRKAISMNKRHLASHNNLALLLAKRQETLQDAVTSWEEVRKLAEEMKDAARIERATRNIEALRQQIATGVAPVIAPVPAGEAESDQPAQAQPASPQQTPSAGASQAPAAAPAPVPPAPAAPAPGT